MRFKLHQYISEGNLRAQKRLHNSTRGYGGRGDKWAPTVETLALDYECRSILDYGCGQGTLKQALKAMEFCGHAKISEYDPAITGKDSIKKYATFDLVVCTDVLEHIEPNRLAVVIDHIYRLADKLAFIVIATRPSNKFFPDGRNVHLIIEPAIWWQPRLEHPHFEFLAAPKSPMDIPSREYVVLLRRKTPR